MNNDVLIDQIKVLSPNEVSEMFHQLVKDNNLKSVETLLSSEMIDINNTNKNKEPSLYYTIINQQWKMAQLLIQHKALLTRPSWSNTSNQTVPDILHYAIQDHNVDETFIDFLLSQESTLIHIEQKDQAGYTPILTAARYGNIRILNYLSSKYNPYVHAKSNNDCNLFHCAILSQEKCTIELLDLVHSMGVDINEIDKGQKYLKTKKSSPLTYAIYNGLSFEIIQKLVELGADIITTNDRKYNPNGDNPSNMSVQSHLFKAIEIQDDHQIFNYLIESSISINIPFKSIIRKAFMDNNFQLVKLIIEKHRIKFDSDTYQIDLFSSIFKNYSLNLNDIFSTEEFPVRIEMIQYLLGQNVQGCFNFGIFKTSTSYIKSSALLALSQYPQSSLKLLQLMVQRGANIHDITGNGFGIIHILCSIKNGTSLEDLISKIDYFISLGVNINLHIIDPKNNIKIMPVLSSAVRNNAFASTLVPYLIQHYNPDITRTDDRGGIPLHYVFHPELVQLLSTPEIINQRDTSGVTPLLLSIFDPTSFPSPQHYFEVVSNLLNYGADINIPNNAGVYPIQEIFNMSNFQHQPIDLIKFLIQHHHVNLNVVDYANLTPLQLAIDRFFDPIEYNENLIDDFGDDTYVVTFGVNMCLVRSKAIISVKLLLQHNTSITVQDNHGGSDRTILHYITDSSCNSDYFNEIDDDLIEELMEVIMEGVIDRVILNIDE